MVKKVLRKLGLTLLKGKNLCSGLETFRCLFGQKMMVLFQQSAN